MGEGMTRTGGNFAFRNGVTHYPRFYGNQYTTVHSMAKWGGRLGKAGGAAGVVTGGVQVYQGMKADGGNYGYNAQHASAEVAGGAVGGWAGAITGAAIGSAGGPVGIVVGGIVGAVGVGWAGSYVGGRTHDLIVK
jgi:phage tail tape-measure protein